MMVVGRPAHGTFAAHAGCPRCPPCSPCLLTPVVVKIFCCLPALVHFGQSKRATPQFKIKLFGSNLLFSF